ncbi:hypothetical protein SLA2020_152220 [Shorea laevis]
MTLLQIHPSIPSVHPPHLFKNMNYFLLFVLLLVISEYPLSSSAADLFYRSCSNQVRCGKIVADFPFWGGEQRPLYCGHPGLELQCENDTALIKTDGVRYRVLDIDPPYNHKKMRIAREDYEGGLCPQNIQNTTLDTTLFASSPDYRPLTLLYGCPSFIPPPDFLANFSCNNVFNSSLGLIVPGVTGPMNCSTSATVLVPISASTGKEIEQALKDGFEVELKVDDKACQKCLDSKGMCGVGSGNQTVCYCLGSSISLPECPPPPANVPAIISLPAPPPAANKPGKRSSDREFKLILVAVTVVVTTTLAISFLVLLFKFKEKLSRSLKTLNFGQIRKTKMNDERVEAFILEFGNSLAPQRFSYSDIKKITNSFSEKLGQGGFGSVYKGTLLDGRIVAVKLLAKSKGDGQEFINEVASISRTSHVNIVTLLGFCYQRSKRALIYEFMPNGSLDKFIYNQGSPEENHQLDIKTLYEIAVGIAQGLEYLHKGCNSRILHFDIKPHNILLDKSLCPKISDFGLAKLCETRDSIVSITGGARGTCGYIAPEMICRNFGGVSYKSDVYSYGMLVLEMIGGRKNVNVEATQTSETYFPSWIYKQIEKAEKLNLDRVVDDGEEEEMTRKMVIVSLWCIQTIPSNRPSMTKVLEMFQGSLEALPLPPEPLLSSPGPAVRSPKNSSTTSSVTMQGISEHL